MTEELRIRTYGDKTKPVLVYLPGLHGDWTLIGGFREAVRDRVHFVEMTYPRTLAWSLEDYASAIEDGLAAEGINSGWLLGESFGSQVLWALLARRKFNAAGAVLAGGFGRHPVRGLVKAGEKIAKGLPLRVITNVLFGYSKVARWRFRHEPTVLKAVEEFIARRTELDRSAAVHRLRLIAAHDPCAIAKETSVPLYGLTGLIDPVVPWVLARRWLRSNCPTLRDYRIVKTADHNVLSTASRESAEQILKWMA